MELCGIFCHERNIANSGHYFCIIIDKEWFKISGNTAVLLYPTDFSCQARNRSVKYILTVLLIRGKQCHTYNIDNLII